MSEPVRQLHQLDRLDPTDLWADIELRTPGPEPQPPVPPARRAVIIVAALAIAAAAIGLPTLALLGRGQQPVAPVGVGNGPLMLIGLENPPSGGLQIYGGPRSLWSFDVTTELQQQVQPPVKSFDPLSVFAPRWSPDGTHELWFTADGHDGPGEIWTNVNGTLTKIVGCPNSSQCVWEPAWSPDGSQIAFARGSSIMVVNPDGSGLRTLATCPGCTGLESGPTWSPEGRRVAFAASDANYDGVIYVANVVGNADLTAIARCSSDLCHGGIRDAFVQWSPVTDTLLFSRERNLWSVAPDGSGLTRLTDCPVTARPNTCEPGIALWSPDGTKIAYTAGTALIVMNADGSDPRSYGLQSGYSFYLDAWQPVAASSSPSPTSPPTSIAPAPVGTDWRAVSIALSDGSSVPVVDAMRPTLTFSSVHTVKGTTGCSPYEITWRVTQAGSLSMTGAQVPLLSLPCFNAEVHRQQSAFWRILDSATRYDVAGDRLSVTGNAGSLSFRRVTGATAPSSTQTPGGPSIARCNVADLRLSIFQVSEATGQNTRELVFTNISSAPCSLLGYPHVAVLDPGGQPIPFVEQNAGDQMVTSRPPATVVLPSGGLAFARINKYRCDLGGLTRSKTLVIALPGGSGSLTVPVGRYTDFSYCGSGDPGSVISISPFEPTEAATSAH
jgi:Tol biopolymer transport system component